jgi:hypothetical protein
MRGITKMILFVLALMVTLPVLAEGNFAKMEYAFRDMDGDTPNKNGANLTVGTELNKTFAVDGKLEARWSNGDDSNFSKRLEAGLTGKLGNAYLRGGVGEKLTPHGNYSYYTIEPGYKFDVTKDLKLVTAYRFRDAFSSEQAEETHQVKLGAEYAIAADKALVASVGRSWGDIQYNSVNLGYAIKF